MEEQQIKQSSTDFNSTLKMASADPVVVGYDLSRYQYFLASPFFAGFDDFKDTKRKLFLEEFKQMPPNVRAFLTSVVTAKTIFTTGKDNNLEEYQIYQTAELFRDLVSGKIFIKELSVALAQKINIDDIKAREITNKIVSQSFGLVVEDLKRIQRSKFPEKIMQLQKEGRPAGLSQTKPPLPTPQFSPIQRPSEERGSTEHNSANVPQTPRLDIRPPVTGVPSTEVKPLDSIQKPPASGVARPEGRQFKIPDLGQPVTKENNKNAQKSLEEELEKVASVIDLRDKPPDK